MTTPSSTDSTDRVGDAEAEKAEATTVVVDASAEDDRHADETPEIVAELVEEDDLVEGAEDDVEPYGFQDSPASGSASIVASGAAAVTAAGLAITSLGGNWLGDILSQRQSLIGQINTANAQADAIIKQRYTDVWHKQAFVSMGFAIAAVVIAAAALFLGAFAAKQQAPVWVRVLTWGALVLGVVGLGVAAAMYFDVFTGTITVPAGAASGGQ
ncbi:conserved hypothetical protein [Catenulispora acidiphila DSM 44928]|uniref:Uncharacterized protein n=1 Tax=Catenulispora acidiphila (strain DSM 44928 / JCM 14897 / NBRC 102108 / NRRL B-24433 / ID139908) TaxID=479433 RepID=C7PVP7_CATAD|nr:hypothetical protein [Catenulispora acidiphila]ACU71289.1 conserved hypothetical protein [Catenulispora acidiphila DSM 44928]